jgi:transposase
MVVGQKPRPSSLDSFKPYPRRRIGEGCLKATVLHREVTAQGFTGGYGIVRAFVEQHRTHPDLNTTVKPVSVREVTGWICRHPDHLVERDARRLRAILGRCPELAVAVELVRSFAAMLTGLRGGQLGARIAAAEQAALSGITGFATGLNSDLDAVTAGLSLPHSSGPVEGNVNRKR